MRRREFITLIGGAAVVWSSRVHGQHPAVPTIGWLNLGRKLRIGGSAKRSGLVWRH